MTMNRLYLSIPMRALIPSRNAVKGKIRSVQWGLEDRWNEHNTVTVFLDLENGFSHSFGTLLLTSETQENFLDDLFEAFDVKREKGWEKKLIGKECFVLYAFNLSDSPEGLQSLETGKRITLTGFRRRHVDPYTPSPLRAKELSLSRYERLSELREKYVDWEQYEVKTEPPIKMHETRRENGVITFESEPLEETTMTIKVTEGGIDDWWGTTAAERWERSG
jgi:hypothetical protein